MFPKMYYEFYIAIISLAKLVPALPHVPKNKRNSTAKNHMNFKVTTSNVN